MDEKILPEFVSQSVHRMEENTEKTGKCLQQLSEDELWKAPNDSSNSIGNLILHLCGNIRQYAISSLGNLPDVRERDLEFSKDRRLTKKELIEQLTHTVKQANDTISSVSHENLLRKRDVQGYHFSGLGVILHVVEHYSYHTGQIALLTKLWQNKDLGFYDGIDLNTKNG